MHNRLSRTLAIAFVLSSTLAPVAAVAQNVPTAAGASFVFGAPCEDRLAGTGSFAGQLPAPGGASTPPCLPFTANGQMYQTPETPVGTPVRLNVYLSNPAKMPIDTVHLWLAYDPEALSGSTLTIGPRFTDVTAAETGFFPAEGYIKITAHTGKSQPADTQLLIATIEVRPLSDKTPSTALSFYGVSAATDAKTKVTSGNSSGTTILDLEQPSLMVRIAAPAKTSSSSSSATTSSSSVSSASASGSVIASSSTSAAVSSAALSSESSSSIAPLSSSSSSTTRPAASSSSSLPAGVSTEFRRAQVQGLAIGTQNGNAILSWLPLQQPGIAGYHLYYSSVTGVYTQRRTLAATANGDIVTGLPNGERYFFAIRAYNALGIESDYSREVAVVIGQPNTATAPLAGSVTGTVTPLPTNTQATVIPSTSTTVVGKTGVSDVFNGILAIAAAVGMWAAFRRQFTSSPAIA